MATTRLTVKSPPPTYAGGGTAGQFEIVLAILARKPINGDIVALSFQAVTTGFPTDG
jgi:hypothetical protein